MFPASTQILVVDDMKGVRVLLARVLNELGFKNIHEAGEGEEAKRILESMIKTANPIGLVVSDMRMPGVDGLQLLEFVRAHDKLKTLPFIMLSAESDKDAIISAVRAGVDDYIIKPASASGLKQKLEKVYEKRHVG